MKQANVGLRPDVWVRVYFCRSVQELDEPRSGPAVATKRLPAHRR